MTIQKILAKAYLVLVNYQKKEHELRPKGKES